MNEPIRKVVRVRCGVEHAFDVFTARIDLWWPASHRRFPRSVMMLDPAVGGRFAERSPAGEEVLLGEVIRCEPPRAISYTWYPGAIAEPTVVDVRFTDEGDHTIVEVTHSEAQSGLGDAWPQRAKRFLGNWDEVLAAFVELVTEKAESSGR
jgi:uncharacterized protein YndB with AHSA1/START domain